MALTSDKIKKMEKKLEAMYKELSTPATKGQRRGTTPSKTPLSTDFTGSGKNRKNLQAEFDKLAAQLKKEKVSFGKASKVQEASDSIAVSKKRSPTDVMRQTGRRREVLAGPKVKQSGANKPVAPKKPAAAKKPSGNSFAQAFKEARAKYDAGTGNTTFKFNGSSYSVAKPAELKAAGGTYGKKLNDMLKSKQRSSETDKQVTNKRGSNKEGPRQKMLNRLEREKTAKKSYGGGMTKKTARRKSGGNMAGKPKGVGCATRGYGKAMK